MQPMKTNEEPNALKEKEESANENVRELTDKELAQVTGGKAEPASALIRKIGGLEAHIKADDQVIIYNQSQDNSGK